MRSGIPETKCPKTPRLMNELVGIWHIQKIVHAGLLVGKSWKK